MHNCQIVFISRSTFEYKGKNASLIPAKHQKEDVRIYAIVQKRYVSITETVLFDRNIILQIVKNTHPNKNNMKI